MKLEELVAMLENRRLDQLEEVEFVVVTKEGRIIALDLETQAKSVKKALKLFGA